jgi:hypothetical protein
MNTRILASVTAGLLAVGVTAVVMSNNPSTTSSGQDVRQVETLAVTDLSDDRKLVGLSHNVFLGTVIQEQGKTTSEPLPETQYDVRVLRTVKGSVAGDVVVSQQGGMDENGDTVVVDGDVPLEIGQTYLFAARTNAATGWHTLIPHYGILPADAKGTRPDLLERFGAAKAVQVPFSPRD